MDRRSAVSRDQQISEDGNVQATITCHRRRVDLLRYLPIAADVALALVEAGPQRFVGSRAEGWSDAQACADLRAELPGVGSVTRSARVGFGPLMDEDGATVLPVWWEDAEHPDLFPTFDGGLELYPDGRGTALRLVGSYVPPLGLLGRFGDGLAGHRIVLASLNKFLADVAALLTAAAHGDQQS
jgi:hypothetical protein